LPPVQLPATCRTDVTRRACAPLEDPLLIEPALEEGVAVAVDPVVEPVAPAVEPVGDVELGLDPVAEPVLPVLELLEDPIEEPADSSVPRISTREFT
jgi:hypothetical protein